MVELDFERKLVAMEPVQPRPLEVAAFALTNFDGALDANEALGLVLQRDACALQQVDK